MDIYQPVLSTFNMTTIYGCVKIWHMATRKHKVTKQNIWSPELCFEFGESWSLAGVIWPTFGHQTVEGGRALRRHSQPLAVLYPANHVIVLHPLERLDAVHQDLPHAHSYRDTGEQSRRCSSGQKIIDKHKCLRQTLLVMEQDVLELYTSWKSN